MPTSKARTKAYAIHYSELHHHHQDDLRAKVQGGALIQLLQDHALKNKQVENSRLQAAAILLRKVIPDLSATELSMSPDSYVRDLLAIAQAQGRVIEHERLALEQHANLSTGSEQQIAQKTGSLEP